MHAQYEREVIAVSASNEAAARCHDYSDPSRPPSLASKPALTNADMMARLLDGKALTPICHLAVSQSSKLDEDLDVCQKLRPGNPAFPTAHYVIEATYGFLEKSHDMVPNEQPWRPLLTEILRMDVPARIWAHVLGWNDPQEPSTLPLDSTADMSKQNCNRQSLVCSTTHWSDSCNSAMLGSTELDAPRNLLPLGPRVTDS
jgi:hypothetical protein